MARRQRLVYIAFVGYETPTSRSSIRSSASAMSIITPPTSAANTAKLGEVGGIAIVNFSPFIDGTNKQGVADALLDSFKSVGFAYVVNHGLPKDKIESMFDWVRTVLCLPHPSWTHILYSSPRSSSRSRWRPRCSRRTLRRACTLEVGWSYASELNRAFMLRNGCLTGYSPPGQEKLSQHVYDKIGRAHV